jgi:mono/diheme cytochrome c family protein
MRNLAFLLPFIPLAAMAQLPPVTASTGPAVSEGARIAGQWCANCHAVGPGGSSPTSDAAPPFAAVAQMPSTTEMSLRAFLATSHSNMPDYQLSRTETDAVVAYILSLKR